MAHTPGPWQCRPIDTHARVGAFEVGARDCDMLPSDAEANARLIAAAPDLYDALKAITDAAYGNPRYPDDTKRIDAMAEAAIAKAEGRLKDEL